MRAPALGQDRERLLDGRRTSRSPAAASTTRRSTRWRRSATRCASRCAGFGVDVVVIQPGLIRTGFGDAAVGVDRRRRPASRPVRRRSTTRVAEATQERLREGPAGEARRRARGRRQDDRARDHAPGARRSATASRRARTCSSTQRAVMTDGMWDAFLRTQFPQPGKD